MQLKVENEESKEKVGLYSSCFVPFLDLREVLRSQDVASYHSIKCSSSIRHEENITE